MSQCTTKHTVVPLTATSAVFSNYSKKKICSSYSRSGFEFDFFVEDNFGAQIIFLLYNSKNPIKFIQRLFVNKDKGKSNKYKTAFALSDQ